MFTQFTSHFHSDGCSEKPSSDEPIAGLDGNEITDFLRRYAGKSFNCGLYRVMDEERTHLAREFIQTAFPTFASRALPFAYDWSGRIFALDGSRLEAGLPAVLIFEPGTGEVLEVPCNLITFHENEIIDCSDASLGAIFYKKWLDSGGIAPTYDHCIGYKRPLFLSGTDDIKNLELSDLDVYWNLSGQLIQKVASI